MKNNLYDFYCQHYNIEKLDYKISDKKIVFLIYDDKYYYYLEDNKLIEMDTDGTMISIVNIISKKYKLDILNYYPVCLSGKTLVIALRIKINEHTILKRSTIREMPDEYKTLINYHAKNFKMNYISANVNKEIKMSKKYISRYKIHEKIIKKCILTSKLRKKEEFKEMLYNYLPDKESILDISCGDNSDIFDVAKQKKIRYYCWK